MTRGSRHRRQHHSRWESLSDRLSQESRQVRVGNMTFALQCLGDMEEALSASLRLVAANDRSASAANTAEFNPYFGVIWPAAVALAEYLDEKLSQSVQPRSILELRCGLALPSLVAAARGVPEVIATDRHPMVAEFLERNVVLNKLRGIQYRHLDWRALSEQSTSQETPGIQAKRADLIVGSDLLYEAWQPGYLATALAHLLGPNAKAVLADPGRRYMDDFLNLSVAHGLVCEDLQVREVVLGDQVHNILVAILIRG